MAAQVFARIVATFLVFCSGVGPVLGSIITGESMSGEGNAPTLVYRTTLKIKNYSCSTEIFCILFLANIHKEHVMLGDFILEVATGKGELAKKWRAMSKAAQYKKSI